MTTSVLHFSQVKRRVFKNDLKLITQYMSVNVLALSCMTCDVCGCIIIVSGIVCSPLFFFSFSGTKSDFVDRYDSLRYGFECEGCNDEY